MKTTLCILIIFLSSVLQVFAQNQDLTGLIKDVKNKPVRNQEVSLGLVHPVTVKTDRAGMFVIPKANLQDTLYIELKNSQERISIPVNGYKFIAINRLSDDMTTEYLNEPNEEMTKIIRRQQKMKHSSTMDKERIEKSGCKDLYCLLSRLNVSVFPDGRVLIKGSGLTLSGNATEGSLVVLNGMISNASVLRTIVVEDLEEITILKDASEYGSRGADGAIVIKTKTK